MQCAQSAYRHKLRQSNYKKVCVRRPMSWYFKTLELM